MKINIRVPMSVTDEKDDDRSIIKFFDVKWDSEKGSLEGDELPVGFLMWAIENVGPYEYLPHPGGNRDIKNPLTELDDMAYVLHSNGINLPEELQEYCSSWSLSQQYYDLREFIENGSLVF